MLSTISESSERKGGRLLGRDGAIRGKMSEEDREIYVSPCPVWRPVSGIELIKVNRRRPNPSLFSLVCHIQSSSQWVCLAFCCDSVPKWGEDWANIHLKHYPANWERAFRLVYCERSGCAAAFLGSAEIPHVGTDYLSAAGLVFLRLNRETSKALISFHALHMLRQG
jgi:hypothetical protein